MGSIDYKKLYELQDKVLQVVFDTEREFYLTGGTCLSRFYVENILSNKITAVVGRDNPKDVFDIFLIYKFYKINWKDILESAHQKAGFSDEELIIRLKSFPKELLNEIKIIDSNFLNDFDNSYSKIIDAIINLEE